MEQAEKLPNLSLEQTAAYMQLSPRTIQNFQDHGILKPVYFGKRRFFRRVDVERLARRGVALADLRAEAR